MKRSLTLAGIAIATVMLLACGGGDDKVAAPAPEAAAPERSAAAKPPPVAAEVPAAAEVPPAAAAPEDVTKQCLALAAQQKWTEALEPCTEAAKAYPTDLRIKHAAQQAQAAAEG